MPTPARPGTAPCTPVRGGPVRAGGIRDPAAAGGIESVEVRPRRAGVPAPRGRCRKGCWRPAGSRSSPGAAGGGSPRGGRVPHPRRGWLHVAHGHAAALEQSPGPRPATDGNTARHASRRAPRKGPPDGAAPVPRRSGPLTCSGTRGTLHRFIAHARARTPRDRARAGVRPWRALALLRHRRSLYGLHPGQTDAGAHGSAPGESCHSSRRKGRFRCKIDSTQPIDVADGVPVASQRI